MGNPSTFNITADPSAFLSEVGKLPAVVQGVSAEVVRSFAEIDAVLKSLGMGATDVGTKFSGVKASLATRQTSLGATTSARFAGDGFSYSATLAKEPSVEKIMQDFEKRESRQFFAQLSGMGKQEQIEALQKRLSLLNKDTSEYAQTLTRLNGIQRETTSRFDSMAMKIAASVVIWEGLRYVTQTITDVIDAQREYSLETARFAAITNQNVGSAIAQWDRLADVAARAGVAPMQAASTIRVAAQMGANDAAGQEMFVQTTTRLEELTGVASDTISKSLSSALRQAGKPLGDVGHIGDLIASSLQRIPAAKLEDVINALEEAPALARLWGVDFEEAFNIIIEGSSRAQEGPEQVATAFQRLSQGLNELAQGGEKAFTRQKQLMSEYGLTVNDAGGKLKPIPEILRDVAGILPTLSAPRQQDFLNLISGGSVRPEQLRTIVGGIEAFNVDLGVAIQNLDGTLKKMTDVIDQSLGQSIKVLDAKIAELQEKGDLLSNLTASILRGTVGQFGGKQGAYVVEQFVNGASGQSQGTSAKQGFLDQIIQDAAGRPDDIARLAKEHNKRVADATAREISNLGGVFSSGAKAAALSFATGLLITEEDIQNAIKAAGGTPAPVTQTKTVQPETRVQTVQKRSLSPQQSFAEYARGVMLNQEGGLTGESVLPTQQLDLTKYSMDEINQAKQLALQLDMMELEALRAQLAALGFSKDQVDGIVSKRKEELDTTILLLRTQQGLSYEIGNGADKLQEALQQMDKQKQEMSSSFQFRRLKDVDPSQFGQLEALAQMYNKFLTNIGSPEKSQNINLLMGENNVFKTMNVRMTALQLALEDLTKVEKAQLSGTWNMPTGATALVPISSLDLQRWNAKGGGGLSEEAIRALMGATAESGTGVENAVMRSSQDIVSAIIAGKTTPTEGLKEIVASGQDPRAFALQLAQAIREAAAAGIAGARERLTPEKYRTSNALNSMPDFLEELARANAMTKPQPQQSPTSQQAGAFRDMELYRSLLRDSDMYPGQFKSSVPSYGQMETVNVNVSMLPVKATFNANLSVLMDGRVIARTLAPILYDMLIRTARSTGIKPSKP